MSADSEFVQDDLPLEESELLEEMVMAVVDKPSLVRVESVKAGPKHTRLIIHADPADRGKVIGRAGRTVEAMRTFLEAVASRDGRHVTVNMSDEMPRSENGGSRRIRNGHMITTVETRRRIVGS